MLTERVPLSGLHCDPANVRLHSSRNIDAIKASLQRFGQQKPIVVDADNVIRAGNGTYQAANDLGWDEISVVRSELVGPEMTAFAIADNRTAELAEWDEEALAKTIQALPSELANDCAGFSSEDVAAMLDAINESSEIEDDESPEIPDIPEDPVTQPGDIWIMGDHRVLCGDCASPQATTALLDGHEINLAISSPPYASQRKYDETSPFKPIHPDEYLDWFEPVQANIAQHLAEDGSWFLNIKEHCEEGQRVLYVKDLTLAHVRRWGWNFVDEFIWTHGGTPKAVNQRFKNGWEPIFQFTRGRHKFRPDEVRHQTDQGNMVENRWGVEKLGYKTRDGRKQKGSTSANQGNAGQVGGWVSTDALAYPSNVLSLGKNREAVGHPAAFPTSLPSFFIRAYSDEGDTVFEPFLGSGTTLVAAHQLGRRCYGIEISPGYCDVIVQRWEQLTGQTAERVEDPGRDRTTDRQTAEEACTE